MEWTIFVLLKLLKNNVNYVTTMTWRLSLNFMAGVFYFQIFEAVYFQLEICYLT